MSRHRMSENEKVVWMCVLFPPLWIFLPVLALCALGEAIRDGVRSLYYRYKFRNEK